MSDNPARPPAGVDLCAFDELVDRAARGFRFRHERTLFAGFVLRLGEDIRGYVDSCPHAGWPLASFDDRYFTRDGRHLLCTGHAALFRPDDGVCVAGPCEGLALTAWPVRREGERVVTA